MLPSEESQTLALQAKIELCEARLDGLSQGLDSFEYWQPAKRLKHLVQEASAQLHQLKGRIERKLTLVLIGPTGAGKSTLLNALVGGMEISKMGADRPTTKEAIIYCQRRQDAAPLIEALGEGQARVVEEPEASGLSRLILIDTPDTDSIEGGEKFRGIHQALSSQADVLVCVFHGQHPKRRDSTDFLAELVKSFHGSALLAAINQCDRLREDELDVVVRDFTQYLEAGWGKKEMKFFAISAKRHLANPEWGDSGAPLHQRDDFDELQEEIFERLNQGSVVVDTRVRRAQEIVSWVEQYISGELDAVATKAGEIRGEIRDLLEKAIHEVVSELEAGDDPMLAGIDLLFYDQLTQRWSPPLNWLLVVWSKILALGAGVLNLFRVANPAAQVAGAFTSAIRSFRSRKALDDANSPAQGEVILQQLRYRLGQSWQDKANRLCVLGFSSEVRKVESICPDDEQLGSRMAQAWLRCLKETIERRAAACSHWTLQLVFNLPIICLWGWIAFQVVIRFFQGNYISADYARHSMLMLFLTIVIQFVVYQFIITWVKGKRLVRQAIRRFLAQFNEQGDRMLANPVLKELDAIEGMRQRLDW